MSPITLTLTAFGLAADAFAVSVAKGMRMRSLDLRPALAIALTFGLFQGVMPLIGWLLGASFAGVIEPWDHWIAFALLAGIGAKMLWEARQGDDAEADSAAELDSAEASAAGAQGGYRIGKRELLVLGFATSVDALAVGVSLSFLQADIWVAAGVIAAVTFVLAMVGVRLGHHAGSWLSRGAEVAGGLVLIGIGVKILVEHLG